MQPDTKAVAEAKALISCIQVTEDPTEQNRLWNRYYRLSDQVFPEAAALRARYKGLQGAPRQQFKTEYMELVRKLWSAFDPDAAFQSSFANPAKVTPPPLPKRPAVPTTPSSPPTASAGWLLVAVTLLLAVMGGTAWWVSRQDDTPDVERRKLPEAVAEDTSGRIPVPESTPIPLPPLLEDLSESDLDAELARTILPDLKPIPPSLVGAGDVVQHGDDRYADVYTIESEAQYYMRLPAQGTVETVSKEGTTVTRGADPEKRKALLAHWKQNSEAIDAAEARREEVKRVRLASHFQKQEAARAARADAQEKERWRVKGADWMSLTRSQRNAARTRAFNNWRAVQADVDAVEELYYKIVRGYEVIGISDSRA